VIDGFDCVSLGHLHRPQSQAPHIHYAGSLLKYSFSEPGDVKRVLSVQVDKGTCEVNPVHLKPLFDMARVKGTLEGLMDDEEYAAYEDCYLEVELNDRVYPINPLQELKKRFRNILSVRMAAPYEQGAGPSPRLRSRRTSRMISDVFTATYTGTSFPPRRSSGSSRVRSSRRGRNHEAHTDTAQGVRLVRGRAVSRLLRARGDLSRFWPNRIGQDHDLRCHCVRALRVGARGPGARTT